MTTNTHDWTIYAFELISGNVVAEVPFVNNIQFSRKINDPGSGSVYVPLGGQGMSQVDLDQLAIPWRWGLAICYRDAILQAGPVTGETFSASSPGYTQLNFANIWKVFTKRLLLPPASTWTSGSVTSSDANTALSGLTNGGIAQTLVQTQLVRGDFFDGEYTGTLPISFNGSPAVGTETANYNGYDLNIVSDILVNLTTNIGACEIDFAPYWAVPGQNIQFSMRVSDTRLGQLGAPWVWDFGGRGALQDANYSTDGTQQTFSEYARGSGSTTSLIVGQYGTTAYEARRYPLLESVDGNHTSVTDVATLNGYAQAAVQTYQYAITTPAIYIRVDGTGTSGKATGSPTLEEISIGDTGTFVFQGHRRIPDGAYTLRIIEIAQGLDVGSVLLNVQPIFGTW